ncbi:Nucleoside phosphatase GDA1/CD39 [Trinorchestia longiramus]|nr:Nucleoside phosphatase GDA1/CD39 [Trinorchestia longiramus]
MEGVRPRKNQGSANMGVANGNKRHESASLMPPPYRLVVMALYAVAGSLTLLIVAVSLNNIWPFKSTSHGAGVLDRLSVMLGVQEEVYAVIIDAGSTGSRVLAFTFFRSIADNSLKLENQLWHEVKPGLSSYADDPVKGAASLEPLLQLAYSRVPESSRAQTPLVLKATAGLRLLPEHQAQALLQEVNQLLQASEFYTTENSVGIMDGKDEGIFSWFTVNYLLDRVGSAPGETLVALDLGGGSTQITFVPAEQQTVAKALPHQLSSISLMNQNVDLFTHSYLGLGLMAARKDVLLHDIPDHVPGSDDVIRSPCINPTVTTTWHYGGHAFNVAGPKELKYHDVKGQAGRLGEHRPIADYEACLRTCVDVIQKQVTNVPDELRGREVIAFSYFFDRATERGLIDPLSGGVVSVNEFAQAARQTCDIPNAEQPFACLDLTFIAAFLHNGYRLKPEAPIKLFKKIDGYELSWGLGLAFHVINNGI